MHATFSPLTPHLNFTATPKATIRWQISNKPSKYSIFHHLKTALCEPLPAIKITDIKTFPVHIGPGNQLIIKVETDTEHYGWGCSGLSSREQAVVGAIQHFKSFLIGKDPRRIGAIWQELYRSQYFEGGRVLTAAISAIDIALHDLRGKALGVPVYELLGGQQRERIDCFASVKFASLEQMIDNCRALIDEGWNVLRLTHFENDPAKQSLRYDPREALADIAEWLPALRKEIGPRPTLGLDFHHRLSPAETASFMQRMPEGTLDFLEEPIRDETPEAYESLRKMTLVPFAIGEEFASKWQFLPYLERGLAQFARVDVCNVGGLTEAMKVASHAESHYIDLLPHNPLGPICTAASIHLAAAIPNFFCLEEINTPIDQTGTNDPAYYPTQPILEGAHYKIPSVPGLGVDFNEALAAQQNFEFKEVPHFHRPDGSFTNW